MAMGKLGGEELNFSSDVDVCYFYSTDAGARARRAVTLHHYYAELSRRVTAAIEEPTADGIIFRVDLRLRPEGRSGPLCNSLPAAERYYETFGRTWERQAWLRARPAPAIARSATSCSRCSSRSSTRATSSPRMVDEVRALRALFRDPADARARSATTGFDVKLGAGGIRDVELVVQTLQLLHGGKRPDLRERNTPRAVPRLVVAGLLSDREARDAARRLSLLAPARAPGAGGDGRAAPPPAGATRRARRSSRAASASPTSRPSTPRSRPRARAVEAIAATFGEPRAGRPGGGAAARSVRERAELERRLAEPGFRDAEAAADALELVGARMPAAFLAEAIASPDPDRALGALPRPGAARARSA